MGESCAETATENLEQCVRARLAPRESATQRLDKRSAMTPDPITVAASSTEPIPSAV